MALKVNCHTHSKVELSILLSQNDTISASIFGVKADYNGTWGTDNRQALQQAMDYCSKHNKKLLLPKGKILLNSYAKSDAARAHGNILMLRSKLEIIGAGSTLIIGKFFDDKHFIVFSALNNVVPEQSDSLSSITFDAITIDFNVANSKMRTKYLLRKGIEFGHTVGIKVTRCTFTDGDISCAIATGFGNKNISKDVEIAYNRFINLINSSKNEDHTSIYVNSIGSKLHHNYFFNNAISGKLVACAAEFHNSEGSFSNNEIKGYTRMLFLAAILTENIKVHGFSVINNKAEITNAAVYLWLEANTTMDGVTIANNEFSCKHVNGYSMLYNGTQGILADAQDERGAMVKNMTIQDNKVRIINSVIHGRAVKYNTKFRFSNINNSCEGCKDGDYYKP